MKSILRILGALLLSSVFTACGVGSFTSGAYADVRHRAPPQPELKRNPTPTAYELTVTLKDAPGPFASIKGFMQYETKLADPCLPDLGGMAGTRMRIKENVPFELQQVDADTYRGVIYTDLFEDHDYFGLGPCRVGFVEARIDLNPDGGSTSTRFIGGVDGGEIETESAVDVYFPRRQYGRNDMDGVGVPGMRPGTPFHERWKAEDLFSVEMSVLRKP
ncbi:hypothetical protein ARC78_07725 [Stenotrophomonas pictorum JCM 9942]|uniref:Uncharacterized protein n=1 Tax=Stenotrophomonas pictorum JCM 9942 TaxID=1236960 RepID=A0A0R0ARY9_9GAMM|nr:hypothetical protein [Stenotrophomonas pictorum]KRG42867.1 hypothetical protein ARC78_07725 [Stenotrophomonas pictorum JCM 9942]